MKYLIIYERDYNTLEEKVIEMIDMKDIEFKSYAEIEAYCVNLDNKKCWHYWEII